MLTRFAIDDVMTRILWPESLVAADRRDAAAAFARGLPPIFSWLMLECRLSGPALDKVDLLACVLDEGSRNPIIEHLGRAARHPALANAPILEPWAHTRDPRLADVHVLWFEWDAPFTRAEPLQLIAIDPRFWGCGPRATVDQQLALADAGYRATFGAPHDPKVLAQLGRAIERLPRGGIAIFTASFAPRGLPLDRLFVELPATRALTWLDAIGWPGDRTWADHWLARVVAPWEPVYLQIELDGDGVHAHLGIEPCQTSGQASVAETRERMRFLRGLVDDGLVPLARVDALLAWHGCERVGPDRELVRSYHLKCVRSSSGEVAIKAYLGVCYRRG